MKEVFQVNDDVNGRQYHSIKFTYISKFAHLIAIFVNEIDRKVLNMAINLHCVDLLKS